jgi:hypothetical protein
MPQHIIHPRVMFILLPVCFQQDFAAPTELAQQLSAEAAATLDVLLKHSRPYQRAVRSLSYETVWLLVRPTLRVVLWLLPLHIVEAADGIGSSGSCTGMADVTSIATVSLHVL